MFNATESYRQAQVNTVGRADITLMLYDGLLRFLDMAVDMMEKNNIQEKGNYISRALDIINELDSTLNMEKGGEVAKGLHNLYLITNKNLLMANLKNDLPMLKSVRENMQVVRDSFYEAMQTEEAKAMLLKMGPAPVAKGSGGQLNFGGSIQARINQVKEAQQKVEAIKRAQAQFENAKSEEEKAIAKKDLESLLGKKIETQSKPVSLSMAQKASRAFMQQQSYVTPQNSVRQTSVTDVPKPEVSAPKTAPVQNSAEQKEKALFEQEIAEKIEQAKQQVENMEQKSAQNVQENQAAPQETPVQPQVSPAMPGMKPSMNSSLLSKKMSLYKNL